MPAASIWTQAPTLIEWLENRAKDLAAVIPCTAVAAWRMNFVDSALVIYDKFFIFFLPERWSATATGES